jgi:hypothetical protein
MTLLLSVPPHAKTGTIYMLVWNTAVNAVSVDTSWIGWY